MHLRAIIPGNTDSLMFVHITVSSCRDGIAQTGSVGIGRLKAHKSCRKPRTIKPVKNSSQWLILRQPRQALGEARLVCGEGCRCFLTAIMI